MNRRSFLKKSALAVAATTLPIPTQIEPFQFRVPVGSVEVFNHGLVDPMHFDWSWGVFSGFEQELPIVHNIKFSSDFAFTENFNKNKP